MKIYLDQNKWIDLARAIIKPDKNPKYVEVSKLIQKKSDSGEWEFPISITHFSETCTRKDIGSRTRLAKIMSDISKNNSILSFLELEPIEFINSFACLHNKSQIQIKAVKKGILNAVGMRNLTINIKKDHPSKMVENIRSTFQKVLDDADLFWKQMGLFDDQEMVKMMQQDALKTKFTLEKDQKKFASMPAEFRYRVFLIKSFSVQFMKYREMLMHRFGKSPETIIPSAILKDQEKVLQLLESIPSLDVRVKLMYELLKDPNRLVSTHDSSDIVFLSTAIPYTDIVLTERTWKHYANSAKLNTKYGTTIENDLNYLKQMST